jgi:hypothetical protein
MSRLPHDAPEEHRDTTRGRLPLRWAVILLAAGCAAAVAGSIRGPVAAITTGCAALGVLLKIL